MNTNHTTTVLAILDRSAVSGVVKAVLEQGARVDEVSDAIGLAAAFERQAPDVLVSQRHVPWAPVSRLVPMVRRRWPSCRVVLLGDADGLDVDASLPVDLAGLADLPKLISNVSSNETLPTALADAPFGILIDGEASWKNDWISRTFPTVSSIGDLISRSEQRSELESRQEIGELTTFQIDDGSLVVDVSIAGDIAMVVPSMGGVRAPTASEQDHNATIRKVAHDLVQPLRTAAYWVTKVDDEDDAAEQAREILTRAQALVRSLLEGDDAKGVCNLDDVVHAAMRALHATIKEHDVSVEVRQPLGLVAAPALTVDRVFQNLISNAVRYSGPGEPVVIEAVERSGWVEISVTNRGPGDDGSKSGTGLGLGIVRELIERVGGDFEFAIGSQGATAIVRLPKAAR
jgi:signal transduction histidine kinase